MRSQRAFSSWPQSFTASIQYSFHIPLKAEGWVGRDGWLSDLDSCPWEDGHRSSVCTNQARWRATSLTSRKTLQLCHAATSVFDKRPLNECLSVYESVPIQLAWHRFPGPAISNAKIYISNKIYQSNFIKQHSETVTVWNYQNADYRKKIHCAFVIIFGALSFPGKVCWPFRHIVGVSWCYAATNRHQTASSPPTSACLCACSATSWAAHPANSESKSFSILDKNWWIFFTYIEESISYNFAYLILACIENFAVTVTLNILRLPVK